MIGEPLLFVGEIGGETVVSLGARCHVRPLLTFCEHGCRVGYFWTPGDAVRVFGYLLWLAAVDVPE